MRARNRLRPAAPSILITAFVLALAPSSAHATATGTLDNSPASPVAGEITISGTASSTGAGVERVDLSYGPPNTTICSDTTASPTWACTWQTDALPDGPYTLQAVVHEIGGATSAPITRTLVIDNRAPVASFGGFVKGTNPWDQFIDGSTMYVKHWMSGSFTVSIDASDAGSGISYVSFPSPAFGWYPEAGPAIDSTPPYEVTYSWADGDSPGALNATVVDRAGRSSTVPFVIIGDTTEPADGSISYPSTLTGPASITFSEGTDAASGIAGWQLQRRRAPLDATTCGTWGTWTNLGAANSPTSYLDSTVAPVYCYQYQLRVSDRVGNVNIFTTSTTAVYDGGGIDTTPPNTSIVGFVELAGASYQHADGSTLWFNPAHAGSFEVQVGASDARSAMDRVEFPVLGSGWTPDGSTDSTGPSPYSSTYSWSVGSASPGAVGADAFDLPGNSAPALFTVRADTAPPTGGFIQYWDTTSGSLSVTFNVGADDGSGIEAYALQRRAGMLGSCEATWSPWVDLGSVPSPYRDVDLAPGRCYQYRLLQRDRVGNESVKTANTTSNFYPPAPVVEPTPEPPADFDFPTASFNKLPVPASGIVTISGTAADVGRGLSYVYLRVDIVGEDDVEVCNLVTAPLETWSCSLDVTGWPFGRYKLMLDVGDKADNDTELQAYLTVGFVPVPIIRTGTAIADTFRGGSLADVLMGGGGNDRLFGYAGNDRLNGGAGNDKVVGGTGNDKLHGDAGNDVLDGNDHAKGDVIDGGPGKDTCTYNKGDVVRNCEKKLLKK